MISWNTIQWAAENMDQFTGVYGGHHYVAEFTPDDDRFYPWFLGNMKWAAGLARQKNKGFILGEFGAKQDGRTIDGVIQDRCFYWGTPQEPLVSIQVAEAALAAINAGTYAMSYWTFMDCPDSIGTTYVNKWGLSRWHGDDCSTRPIYYAYGLLSKFFRGPAAVCRAAADDRLLRTAAVRHDDRKTWSVAIVNRHAQAVPIRLCFECQPPAGVLRKYVYDPAHVPTHPFGDLPGPVAKLRMSDGRLDDTLAAGSLTVYTSVCDDEPPAAVQGLVVGKAESGKPRLRWKPSPEADFCYYRVYRSAGPDAKAVQIGSTIATEFIDGRPQADGKPVYQVVAVDQSGNASP
jgi:hypothetical protein